MGEISTALDAAVKHLKATRVDYPTWLRNVQQNRYTPTDGSGTEWGKAFAALAAARALDVPPLIGGYVYEFGTKFLSGSWSTDDGWFAQGNESGGLPTPGRVAFDDTHQPFPGHRSIRCEIQPQDPGPGGSQPNLQRAQIALTPTGKPSSSPDMRMREGQEAWYGYAFTTNPEYRVYDKSNWNNIACFHSSDPNARQAPINFAAVCWYADGFDGPYLASGTPNRAVHAIPKLMISCNGGDATDPSFPNENGSNLNVRWYTGPPLKPGQRHVVQTKVRWSAHAQGQLEWWVDGACYLNVTGLNTMWRSGTTVDQGNYWLFENYRALDTTLPTTDVWYSPLVIGDTREAVTIP